MTTELPRLLLLIVLPTLVVMVLLILVIKRKNTPPDMRWPQRNRRKGPRRSERDVPPAKR